MRRLGHTARRIIWAGGLLSGMAALLWLAALALLPLLVSSDAMRVAVEKALSGDGLHTIQLKGEPELQLLPSPRLVLHDVRLPLPPNQSIHTTTVVSRLDIWCLLFGRIEVADVALVRPVLVFSGEVNIAEMMAPLLEQLPKGPALRVVDGTIASRASNGYTQSILRHINGRVERTLTGDGLSLSSVFEWREAVVEATLTIDDMAAFVDGTSSAVRARISGEGAVVRFKGFAGYDGVLSARGDISADADSLRKVMTWLDATVPTQSGFGPLGFTSRLVLEKGTLSLTETRINIDGNKIDGGFLVSMTGEKPKVQGTAAADELNLRHYDRVQFTVNNGQEWNPAPLNLNLLDRFDLDLRFSAGQVSTGSATFTTVAGSAVLSEGKLVLAIGQTNGWGGMLRGTATLSPRWSGTFRNQRGISVQIEAECTNIKMEQALGDLADLTSFEGIGSLNFILRGEGRTIAAIAQDLSGSVELSSNSGFLRGVDVARVLRRIERRPLSGSSDPQGGRTAFQMLEARATISEGVAMLNNLEMDGPQAHLSITGSIGIKNRAMDLHGQAALRLSAEVSAKEKEIRLPFMIEGTWTSPRIMADPLSLIQRSDAAQPLLEAMKGQRDRAATHSLLEHLLGQALSIPGIIVPTESTPLPPAPASSTP